MEKLIERVSKDVVQAKSYIKTGKVLVNGHKIEDPNYKLKANDKVQIKPLQKYVSRAAYKLIAALEKFELDFQNQVVLDIGASTGGFTQVALENGAKKVYALDVGTNQLAYKIRNDERVVALEKTNLKTIQKPMFNEKIDIVTIDVSFISLRRVFDVLAAFKSVKIMALIKPQFEAFRDQVLKGGYVEEKVAQEVVAKIKIYAEAKGFKLISYDLSPIKGHKSKNQEYISFFIKEENES